MELQVRFPCPAYSEILNGETACDRARGKCGVLYGGRNGQCRNGGGGGGGGAWVVSTGAARGQTQPEKERGDDYRGHVFHVASFMKSSKTEWSRVARYRSESGPSFCRFM